MRYNLWAGDLTPPIQMVLGGGPDPIPVGSIANFIMAQVNGPTRIQSPAVIDDPVARTAHYQWAAGDTNVPGVYRAVMQLVVPGALPETFPEDEPIYVVIRPKL